MGFTTPAVGAPVPTYELALTQIILQLSEPESVKRGHAPRPIRITDLEAGRIFNLHLAFSIQA